MPQTVAGRVPKVLVAQCCNAVPGIALFQSAVVDGHCLGPVVRLRVSPVAGLASVAGGVVGRYRDPVPHLFEAGGPLSGEAGFGL